MSNKKRIQKLISRKYKVPRKVTLFASYKMGYDWGRQFMNIQKKIIDKSKHSLGNAILTYVKKYPQSTGVLEVSTYVRAKIRIIPEIKEEFSIFGKYELIDYVVGCNGNTLGFAKPFLTPVSWMNKIHFRNGAVLLLVPLDNPNSRRGLKYDWIISDNKKSIWKEIQKEYKIPNKHRNDFLIYPIEYFNNPKQDPQHDLTDLQLLSRSETDTRKYRNWSYPQSFFEEGKITIRKISDSILDKPIHEATLIEYGFEYKVAFIRYDDRIDIIGESRIPISNKLIRYL